MNVARTLFHDHDIVLVVGVVRISQPPICSELKLKEFVAKTTFVANAVDRRASVQGRGRASRCVLSCREHGRKEHATLARNAARTSSGGRIRLPSMPPSAKSPPDLRATLVPSRGHPCRCRSEPQRSPLALLCSARPIQQQALQAGSAGRARWRTRGVRDLRRSRPLERNAVPRCYLLHQYIKLTRSVWDGGTAVSRVGPSAARPRPCGARVGSEWHGPGRRDGPRPRG